MTSKEKEINSRLLQVRQGVLEVMKDIDSKELYDKLVKVDRDICEVRDFVTGKTNMRKSLSSTEGDFNNGGKDDE